MLLSSYSRQTDLYDDPFCGYYAAVLGNVDLFQFAMGRMLSSNVYSNSHKSSLFQYYIRGALEGGNWECLDMCSEKLMQDDLTLTPVDAFAALFYEHRGLLKYSLTHGYNSSVIEWATTNLGTSTLYTCFRTLLNPKWPVQYTKILQLVPRDVLLSPVDIMFAYASYCHNSFLYSWLLENGEEKPSATACLMACHSHMWNSVLGDDQMLQIFLDNGYFVDAICWISDRLGTFVGIQDLFYWAVVMCKSIKALVIFKSAFIKVYQWSIECLLHRGLKSYCMCEKDKKGAAYFLKYLTDSTLADLVRYTGGSVRFLQSIDLEMHCRASCGSPPYYKECSHLSKLSTKQEYVNALKFTESYADKQSCPALHRWCIDQLQSVKSHEN